MMRKRMAVLSCVLLMTSPLAAQDRWAFEATDLSAFDVAFTPPDLGRRRSASLHA